MTTYDTSLSLAAERHDAEREAAQAAAAPTPQAIRDAEDRVDRMLPGDPLHAVCTCTDVTCHRSDAGAWWATPDDAIAEAHRDWQGNLPRRAHLITQTTTVTAIAA